MDDRIGIAEHEFGQGTCEEGLPHTSGSKEDEGPDRPAGILEIRSGAAECLADCSDSLVLANDARLEILFHGKQFLRLLLLHPLERDSRPLGDHVHDIVLAHDNFAFVTVLSPCGKCCLEIILRLLLGIAECCGLFKILSLDGGFLLAPDAVDLGLQILGDGRAGHCTDTGP